MQCNAMQYNIVYYNVIKHNNSCTLQLSYGNIFTFIFLNQPLIGRTATTIK